MKNLDPDVCKKLREARRKAGLSQSELAMEVGCKQSALSMFEQGDGTKINDEVIEKLSKKFGVALSERKDDGPSAEDAARWSSTMVPTVARHTGFCPNPHCPSHRAYQVEGQTYLRPDREIQDPVGGKFCAVCGELLERHCPSCGAPVHDGAICSWCGKPYLAV